MDAVEFLKTINKICETLADCRECPLHDENICIAGVDDGEEEKAVSIVEQWSKEHPVMTNEQKFREVFGETHSLVKAPSEWWVAEYEEPKGKEMYQLIKGCLEGQDGNQGYTEEVVGVFTFLEDAIDSYNQRQHNGWLSYSVKNMKTGRIIELPMKGEE